MPLSRLDNFLKNVRGNVIYVNPNDLDATDAVDNQGNSMGRPFITIQRALIEAARFSYQQGLDNDRFGKTTVVLYPGEHVVDNRPGWIPDGTGNFRLRSGVTSDDFPAFSTTSNFDLTSSNNILYKLNSIYGGVIVPRGCSVVGQDVRKTKIRPRYVPNPTNTNIEKSAIFRMTGGSYFWQFSLFDGNPNGKVFRDYTAALFTPDYSHHKLTCFEFADGVNNTNIKDIFNTYFSSRTDLDMYYEKVGLAYGPASGRSIQPDYPSSGLDIQPKVDEYRIVGPKSGEVGISSIKAGDGSTATDTITVTLTSGIAGLDVDTAFNVEGVPDSAYNGSFVVTEVVTQNSDGATTGFKYTTPTVPDSSLPATSGSTVVLDVDTIASASPYVYACSLNSVYGLNGLHADGSKVSGFKSVIVDDFRGIGLQKDNNAFVKYNKTSGSYDDSTTVSNLETDPNAKYKPAYYSYHIKASNQSIIELVSMNAVGFANQFVVETGGEFTICNSTSNYGQNALNAKGYRDAAFTRDDVGYVSNIIPPKSNLETNVNLEFNAIDVTKTVSAATTSKLYLYQESNVNTPPDGVIQGYRIGAKEGDRLNAIISQEGTPIDYYARIVMPNTQTGSNQVTSVKTARVGQNVSTGNSISNNIFTFTESHQFLSGESVRFVSDNARLPDGIENNRVYYAITSGLNADQIKVATSLNDSVNGTAIAVNNLGGILKVESRVSDKSVGEIGHPVQYDTTESQWYVTVGTAATDNTLYPTIAALGVSKLGAATPRTYITRKPDNRTLSDKIYKYRYVIPAGSGITSARAPRPSYVLAESSDVVGLTDAEVALQFSPTAVTMSNETEIRNPSFLRTCTYVSSGVISYDTEMPHGLSVGSKVKIVNVTSAQNTSGVGNSGYNGSFTVSEVTKQTQFKVSDGPTADPGMFTNNTSSRTTSLPTYQRVNTKDNFYIYDIEEIREYVTGEQDGVYYLSIVDASTTPAVAPFNDSANFSYSQPIKNLYPQYDRDNPNSNPNPTLTYALPDTTGQVVVDEVKNSVTRQATDRQFKDFGVGIAITDIASDPIGVGHTLYTLYDHGLNRVTSVSIASSGAGYGDGTAGNIYNGVLGPATVASDTTGVNGTVRITFDASGGVTDAKIMNGGTNYAVGDYLGVTGTASTSGFTTAILQVTKIYDNVGDTIRVAGVSSDTYSDYNQLYRVTGISTLSGTKEIQVDSHSGITDPAVNYFTTPAITGTGATACANAYFQVTGSRLDVSSIDFTNTTGVATVTTVQAHGLRPNNSITVGGAADSYWNNQFVVTQNVGLTTFVINAGITTLTPTVTGTGLTQRGYIPGLTDQDGNVALYDENFGGRQQNIYAGITTTLSAAVSNSTTTDVSVLNVGNFDFNIGDYLRIDDEIVRIKTTVSGNPLKVFRGVLGTQASSHISGSVVRRLDISSIELRKPSSSRSTGHTFEYVGYGAGNYSTGLPDRQESQPSFDEQLLAQSLRSGGGVNVYTGMNDSGDFFVGNKKIDATTGKEEVYDTPVPTITGEDVFASGAAKGVDIITPLEVTVTRSINVEGGADGDVLSQFDGPVSFSKKVTSSSAEGIEANTIFLQGDATVSRKYTVGISTPTTSGNPGDITYDATPARGGTTGWVFTTNNDWAPFGAISASAIINEGNFDRIGIATTACGTTETLRVGSGSSTFVIEDGAVGIGSTANGAKLRVEGIMYANRVEGDGSGLFNLAVDSLWETYSGAIHPSAQGNGVTPAVGIGSTTSGRSNITLNIDGTNNSAIGAGGTDLHVANTSKFLRQSEFTGGINLDNNLGIGRTGVTAGKVHIYSGYTDEVIRLESNDTKAFIGFVDNNTGSNYPKLGAVGDDLYFSNSTERLRISGANVGIATATPRATLDVEGDTRLKSYHEQAVPIGSSSNVTTVDLAKGQTFSFTTTENVDNFVLENGVLTFGTSGQTTTFTICITQDSTTARTVNLDNWKTNAGVTIPVYWPGGVVPTLTSSAGAKDIYSFMTFDGGSSLYGVIGGQNFS